MWTSLKQFSIIFRVCLPQYVAINKERPKTYHRKEIWYIWLLFFLEMMASCTTHLDLLRKKYRRWFGICLTTKDIFSFSFNNNALEKCTCGKALEVTFVGEDDIDSEQILSLSESASKRKIQLNNDKSSLDEGIEDDSGACRRIQTCLNGQSS